MAVLAERGRIDRLYIQGGGGREEGRHGRRPLAKEKVSKRWHSLLRENRTGRGQLHIYETQGVERAMGRFTTVRSLTASFTALSRLPVPDLAY
jgi:hypothetical protein